MNLQPKKATPEEAERLHAIVGALKQTFSNEEGPIVSVAFSVFLGDFLLNNTGNTEMARQMAGVFYMDLIKAINSIQEGLDAEKARYAAERQADERRKNRPMARIGRAIGAFVDTHRRASKYDQKGE